MNEWADDDIDPDYPTGSPHSSIQVWMIGESKSGPNNAFKHLLGDRDTPSIRTHYSQSIPSVGTITIHSVNTSNWRIGDRIHRMNICKILVLVYDNGLRNNFNWVKSRVALAQLRLGRNDAWENNILVMANNSGKNGCVTTEEGEALAL